MHNLSVIIPMQAIASAATLAILANTPTFAQELAAPGAQLRNGLAAQTDDGPLPSLPTSSADSIHSREVDDPGLVYRFVPIVIESELGQRVTPVADEDLKAQRVYYRYHHALGRHVWSVRGNDEQYYFAMGEGSTLRIELFDIELSSQERLDVLEALAPRLKRKLEEPERASSTTIYLRLDADDQWRLVQDSPTARAQSVFDRGSGHRWEWHGARRHAVLHTTGDMWQIIDGRYLPIHTLPQRYLNDGCCRLPGSATNVVRTSPISR